MKLQSVSIVGFRSIACLRDLGLGAPTVLAGHNDAGKSAIIHAILFLLGEHALADDDRTYVIGADGNAEAVPERVQETYVEGRFRLDNDEVEQFGASILHVRRISRPGQKVELQIIRSVPEDKRFRDLDQQTVATLQDRLKTLQLDTSKGLKGELIARLDAAAATQPKVDEWVSAGGSVEKALPPVRRFDATSAIDPQTAVRDVLVTNYRAHLASDKLSGQVREIEEQLEALLVEDAAQLRTHIMAKVADIGEVSIAPVVSFTSGNGLKETEVSVENPAGERIALHLSGAGRSRRVALAIWEFNASLLAESGSDVVLLYDEPDTHLDYGHQRELMRLIHEQVDNPLVTVVVASHSMSLIDGTDIGDVVHVKHEDHRTVVECLADDTEVGAHLGAIATSVGLRNTVLLHERLFVGVEGDTEARVLPVLFRLATGRYLESCGIAVWPCRNNEGARDFAKFLHDHGRAVAFLVDQDSKSNAKHVFAWDKLTAAGFDPATQCLYIGNPNEIEDTFTDEQWAKAANQLWPHVDADSGRVWEPEDFHAHRAPGSKFSKDVHEMVRTNADKAPSGKPDMLMSLVLTLTCPDDVPRDLRDKFDVLIDQAT